MSMYTPRITVATPGEAGGHGEDDSDERLQMPLLMRLPDDEEATKTGETAAEGHGMPQGSVSPAQTPASHVMGLLGARGLEWVPGSEVLQLANHDLPQVPDALAKWDNLSPLLMGWMVASVATVAMSFVFGIWEYYGVPSFLAGIMGIVGASLFLCRCSNSITATAGHIQRLAWVAFGLDVCEVFLALILNLKVWEACSDVNKDDLRKVDCAFAGLFHATSLLTTFVVILHALLGIWISRSMHRIIRMSNPVSSGLVTIA